MRILLALLLTSGCGIAALKAQNDAIHAHNEQARQNGLAAQANARTDKFVVAEAGVWLCKTEQQALAGAKCDGGMEVHKNHLVQVIGQAPKDGVWPAAHWDAQGEHRFFVAASAINELPDMAQLDSFADEVSKRYPDAKRIPLRSMNFIDLVEQPDAYKGRYLVIRQPSRDMTNKDFASGIFRFTIPIPVATGSRWLALAQFELKNASLVGDFQKGQRSYQCGPKYCDDFVIVAELTGRTVDRIDEYGSVRRLPVFAIRELGDRYGQYKPQ
jgi:hypothetical protein